MGSTSERSAVERSAEEQMSALNADDVREEYARLREAHYLAADHLRMIDLERETVLKEYHSTWNQMIECSVRIQRAALTDG